MRDPWSVPRPNRPNVVHDPIKHSKFPWTDTTRKYRAKQRRVPKDKVKFKQIDVFFFFQSRPKEKTNKHGAPHFTTSKLEVNARARACAIASLKRATAV